MMKYFLEKLLNKEDFTVDKMKAATNRCLNENVTTSELAAFLTALRAKGETAEEMTGIVEVIRSHSALNTINLNHAMDNCGTGGDQSYSFNISTTAAFVIAGAGITVAKHGNRSISSKTGSADVLEHLGVSLSFSKEQAEYVLQENKIAFLYAPHVHTTLKRFMDVRKDLGLPTIFNVIGPLTNPVDLDAQMIGVYDPELIPKMINSLNQLKRRRAIVVHGAGGMDEVSLAGNNKLALLDRGEVIQFTLHPNDVDLPTYPLHAIRGGTAKENAHILLEVLKGRPSPYYDTTIVNAGVGLFAHGSVQTIQEGISVAKESIASGAAMDRLQQLINYSQKMKHEVM